MAEEKRVTFRVSKEKVEQLDKEIMRAKINDQLNGNISRSDLLRQCVDDLIENLESEENDNQKAPT